MRGFLHAHCGRIFSPDFTPADRFARDLLGDRDLVRMNRLFPFLAVASLGAPFVLGWAMSGTLAGAARHGALRHQIDPSAMLIRAFERLGWATGVRWPTAGQSG